MSAVEAPQGRAAHLGSIDSPRPERLRRMHGRTHQPDYPIRSAALRERYEQLFAIDRPAVVEIVHWAAGNGDRSENGDYIYGRQKLRAIDRELGQLSKKMKVAQILDPSKQEDRSRIFFGACVTIADVDDVERTITILGDDEADAGNGRIGWNAPFPVPYAARAWVMSKL